MGHKNRDILTKTVHCTALTDYRIVEPRIKLRSLITALLNLFNTTRD